MREPTPTARRIQLGLILRGYRERCGLTPKDVTGEMKWYSPVKVTKVEKGAVRLSPTEIDRLIALFQIDGSDADRVREYASTGRRPDSVAKQLDGSEALNALLSVASEIKYYGGDLLPGFMQTDDYIRALLATSVAVPAAEIDRRAAERISRRQYLTRTDAPTAWIIVDEVVLWRPVGGIRAHRAQLTLLREIAELPNVTLQVIPFATGEHVAMGGRFYHLAYIADPQWMFVYLEGLSDAELLDRPPHTDIYRLAFDRLRVTATDDRHTGTAPTPRTAVDQAWRSARGSCQPSSGGCQGRRTTRQGPPMKTPASMPRALSPA